jgi:hypothetical protein
VGLYQTQIARVPSIFVIYITTVGSEEIEYRALTKTKSGPWGSLV